MARELCAPRSNSPKLHLDTHGRPNRAGGRVNRTQRFIGGMTWGHISLVVVTATGLWFTPFLLRHLGQRELGLWFIALQILGYLTLTDFGIVALLSRDIAYAVGRSGGRDDAAELGEIVGQTLRLTLCQLPIVAISAIAAW